VKRSPETKELFRVKQVQSVNAEEMEVIFGREFKLEAADPYLFFAYMFRNLFLLTRLIVRLGYGFDDAHINKMLTQSLRTDPERSLLVVQRCGDEERTTKANEIRQILDIGAERQYQVTVRSGSAKQFLETANLAESLVQLIPASKDVPF
jgi:hypothetical protein